MTSGGMEVKWSGILAVGGAVWVSMSGTLVLVVM
jgi:hypothetical protein